MDGYANGSTRTKARAPQLTPASRARLLHVAYGVATCAVFIFFLFAFGRHNVAGLSTAASWDAAVETGNTMIAIIGPIVAGKAAWDISALRKGQVFQYPNVRSHWQIFGRALMPIMAWGMTCMAVIQVVCARYARDSFRIADAVVLLTAALMVVGLALFGAMCGMVLQRLWATAATIVIVFFGLLFPSAVQPMWLRHLNGYEDAMGIPNTMLSIRAVCAPVLVYIALIICCITVLGMTAQRSAHAMNYSIRRLVVAFAASVALVVIAVLLALPFGSAPVVARDTSTICAQSGSTKVCVWPEHEEYLPQLVDDVHKFDETLSAAGITVPVMVSERIPDKATMTISVNDLSAADESGRQRILLDAYTDFAPSEIDGCSISETLPAYQQAIETLNERLQAMKNGAEPASMSGDASSISRAISDARAECQAHAAS